MIISVVKYTVRLYLSTDAGLSLVKTYVKNDPVPDSTVDGVVLSFLVSCGLEAGNVYYYEIDVVKRLSTGREYVVSSEGIFRPGKNTYSWESDCDEGGEVPPAPETVAVVEWDFDITQFIGNDDRTLNWYYRVGQNGEWVLVDSSFRTMVSDSIEHVSVTVAYSPGDTVYIRGDALNEDYSDISENFVFTEEQP